MFNLDQAVAEWRRQMLAAGIKTPVPLDELESHLREDVEQQIQKGLTAQSGFEMAVQKVGQANDLHLEFKKVERPPEQLLRQALRPLWMAGVIGSGLWYLRHTYLVFKFSVFYSIMGITDQAFALVGLAVIVLSICSLPYRPRLFPAVGNERIRMAVILGLSLSGLFYWRAGRYIGLYSPALSLLLWRIVPYLTVIGFTYGLEPRPASGDKSKEQYV